MGSTRYGAGAWSSAAWSCLGHSHRLCNSQRASSAIFKIVIVIIMMLAVVQLQQVDSAHAHRSR